MAMNRELKARWCAALRSGEFKQGRIFMHEAAKNTYCCLGVLREVEPVQSVKEDHYFLTPEEKMAYGISPEEENALVERNDGLMARGIPQMSFSQIADYIEVNL